MVEILAATSIIAVLGGIAVPAIQGSLEKAKCVKEIAGARRAISAWQSYAADNNGIVLPGYKSEPGVVNARGEALRFPVSARYVFRLAPYLDYRLRGTLLVNKQEGLTSDYSMSVAPSFGLNLTFAGGDFGSGSDLQPNDANFATYGKFVVTRLVEIHSPGKFIVFSSARFKDASLGQSEGYNAVRSPFFETRRWPAKYNEAGADYDFGNVHLRFDGRAVCAMADGHVELLDFSQLEDMRRWSNQAAQADDPNWTLQPL